MDKSKLGILLLLLFIIGIVSFLNSNYFTVKKVHITGNELLSDKYILKLCNLNRKVNIFNVQQEGLANKLVNLPQVKGAIVKRDLPREVFIKIKERVPVAIISDKSSYVIIDKEGWVLDTLENANNKKYPLFIDKNLKKKKNKVELNKNSQLAVDYLSKLSKKLLEEIQQLKVLSSGEVLLILREGGRVNLGKDFSIAKKAKIFNRIYNDLEKKKVKVKYINLKYNRNIFIKVKK
ncbi:cell division protein FtsQ/DivIB [Halanaerobacter jeridensis]|uniref:Cell division protein FtsQ n=1 Tax=Halanaerobacter jeridensis TaxID=706427 RepID=A0A939BT70_9FIRM|nr:FtsQ-type POTRA domain-containing protein [Halanaerobacter jeridensis]MBM7557931.1 cell division protein FtsQ [Halanaerobacter jeridensis]